MKRTNELDEVQAELVELRRALAEIADFIHRDALQREDRDRDLLSLQLGQQISIARDISISTENPIAHESADHKFPRGTLNDNTRHPRFVNACERIFGRKVSHLDLGCAGGGLVWDFLLRGHFSVGIEGSDYSRAQQRAEWRTIPSHLFTADITKPFRLSRSDSPLQFDIITAWEVLEHIPEQSLDGLMDNIHTHLAEGGMLVCSVATFEDANTALGATWHVTVKPREWWLDAFRMRGLLACESPFQHADYVRGSGNPRAHDWDSSNDPSLGFHLVARRDALSVDLGLRARNGLKKDTPHPV